MIIKDLAHIFCVEFDNFTLLKGKTLTADATLGYQVDSHIFS